MIILEKPYVSEFLKSEILQHGWPVLDNAMARQVFGPDARVLQTETAFAARYARGGRLYSNSENAIGWVDAHLPQTPLPGMIALCKDKVLFREALRSVYPEFRFRAASLSELGSIDPSTLPMPCIIKPAVGFFSMGVHRIDSPEEWPAVVAGLEAELAAVEGIYPDAVMDGSRFIIEACIEGEEYAVDAYYDEQGTPVIVNILHHVFASGKDVSDRIYTTSADIMTVWFGPFMEFLTRMGEQTGLRNFPVHLELRVAASGPYAGQPVPIEVNPMRFAGWCTTDVAYHAWGISPYACFLENVRPDWPRLLRERAGRMWSIAIAELPADVRADAVSGVDCEGLAALFGKVCEVRCIDWKQYPVMAILFPETETAQAGELDRFLRADLHPYARMA